MAMKSYFMDELHSILAGIVNCKSKTKDSNSVDVKVSEVQSIIVSTKAENKLLKESCSNKQKLLEAVLEHNSVLIRGKSKHVVNPSDNPVSLYNRFYSRVTFLYPLKRLENQRFSDVFRGYRNVTMD